MYEVHGVLIFKNNFPKLNYQRCVFRPFNFCSTTKNNDSTTERKEKKEEEEQYMHYRKSIRSKKPHSERRRSMKLPAPHCFHKKHVLPPKR